MTRSEQRALMRNLHHVCGVFHNGFAPPGWVEIQRFDTRDTGPEDLPKLESDDEAAMLVAERAGMPGTAMIMLRSVEVFVRLVRTAPDNEPEPEITNADYEALERLGARSARRENPDMNDPDDPPRWIVVVPAVVARAARLINRATERQAARGYT